jgi:hypothetical protein
MKDISEVIDYVCDLIDRGDVNSVEEGVCEFEKCGLNVDMKLVRECLDEEFEEGYCDRWEEVEVLG